MECVNKKHTCLMCTPVLHNIRDMPSFTTGQRVRECCMRSNHEFIAGNAGSFLAYFDLVIWTHMEVYVVRF